MKKYILLAAAAIALAACNDDNNIYVDEPVAAQISATIGQSAVSRASDEEWAPGDRIGITMGDRYHNMEYTTETGNGDFSGTLMYFRNKQEELTVSAYYPYTDAEVEAPDEDITIAVTTDAGNQTPEKQPDIDFLYAKLENVTGRNPEVNFTFSHQMSKLTLTFTDGDGMNVGLIDSYTVEGLVLDGTFETESGVCAANTDVGTKPAPLTMLPTTVKNGEELPSLILFPQTVDKVTLKIHDSDNQDYVCELKFKDNRLAPGNNYQFTIKVNKTELSVNSQINNWNPVDVKTEDGKNHEAVSAD